MWQHSQHSPIIPSSQHNNPDVVEVTVFGIHSFMKTWKMEATSKARYSRTVQNRIDEKGKIVGQVWEFGREAGPELFAHHCGFADRLSNGHVPDYFSRGIGHRADYSRIIELRRNTGEVTFDAALCGKTHDGPGDCCCARRVLHSLSDSNPNELETCEDHTPQQDARKQKNEL